MKRLLFGLLIIGSISAIAHDRVPEPYSSVGYAGQTTKWSLILSKQFKESPGLKKTIEMVESTYGVICEDTSAIVTDHIFPLTKSRIKYVNTCKGDETSVHLKTISNFDGSENTYKYYNWKFNVIKTVIKIKK